MKTSILEDMQEIGRLCKHDLKPLISHMDLVSTKTKQIYPTNLCEVCGDGVLTYDPDVNKDWCDGCDDYIEPMSKWDNDEGYV
jgi:hypothetical protein